MSKANDFVIENGVLTGYVGPGGDVTVPEGVKSIGTGAFEECSGLTRVTVPNGVTSIGDKAFYWCRRLTNITLPSGVTSIGNSAFQYCESLKSITIPDGVTSIGDSAFHDCEKLTSITIPDSVTSIGDSAFCGCEKLTSVILPDGADIGNGAFRGCKRLADPEGFVVFKGVLYDYCGRSQKVVVPDGVTSVGRIAFCGCDRLKSIVIPNSVTSIGGDAFSYCRNLTSVTLPDSLTSIGKRTFEECSRLTSITIPDSVTSIGERAFYNCSSLTSITLPDGLTSIGNWAFFDCEKLTGITIPDSVTSIGYGAFYGCKGLADPEGFVIFKGVLYGYFGKSTEITVPDSVMSIGYGAFSGCSSLTSIALPDSVTSIGDGAFSGCSSLTSITLPDGLTSIGGEAFSDCRSLTSITLPDSVTSIGDKAFSDCRSLTSITLPDGLTSIGNWAFFDCEKLTSITIPDSVTSIGNKAFSDCRSLTSIAIPDSVTSIGVEAFSDCRSLTSITIPDSVTSIENRTFQWCESLTSITLPDSVRTIGASAFCGCEALSDIVIPDGVTSIGDGTFFRCETLTSVILSEGVAAVGEGAFADCQKLAHLEVRNEKCKFGKEPFGNSLPKELIGAVGQLYAHLTDGSLKKYIIRKSVWEKLDIKTRTEIFMNCQGKTLLPLYAQCEQDPNDVGREILAGLNAKSSAKECSAAANFLILFAQKADSALLRAIYAAIKPLKTAAKACASIEADTALMAILDSSGEAAQNLSEIEKNVMAYLAEEKKSVAELAANLKDFYGLTPPDLPEVLCKDGSAAGGTVMAYLLTAHEKLEVRPWEEPEVVAACPPGLCGSEKAITELLDEESLQKAMAAMAENYLGQKGRSRKMFLAYPICRYADEALMEELTRRAPKWASVTSGNNAPSLLTFRRAAQYSETRAAMLLAEKYHELEEYAALRGMTEDTIRDQYLSDIGLDAQDGKRYDLGNQMVTVRLQQDLGFLVELPDGKTAKSLPKKGADEEKYASANADFAQLKKDAKKIVKSRCNALFGDFLSARARSAEDWQRSYLQNPLLRSVAKLVVWSQGKNTFTLADSGAIRSDGSVYKMGAGEIRVAHPMEMAAEDVAAWQSYFRTNNIKQPFEQVWEPAYKAEDIKEDRYKGTEIFYRYAQNAEKHGIHYYDEEFHSCVGFTLDDCSLENELAGTFGHEIASNATFELGRFTFKKFTRKVNHIVYLFDKWTIRSRIAKDDISVMELMQRYNAAQITDFLNTAIENKAVNLTAALLSYKQEHFPEYDAFSEFTLE